MLRRTEPKEPPTPAILTQWGGSLMQALKCVVLLRSHDAGGDMSSPGCALGTSGAAPGMLEGPCGAKDGTQVGIVSYVLVLDQPLPPSLFFLLPQRSLQQCSRHHV